MPADKPLNYITPDGLAKIQEEFHELFNVERPKIVEVVAWAAGNGDRSENGDYIYGKKRLREIDRRLLFLKKRIENAHVVDPKKLSGKTVVFGATVSVEGEDGEVRTYQIVGEDEIDTPNGKISWKSPLARALLGKEEGDDVDVKKPKKTELMSVVAVEFK